MLKRIGQWIGARREALHREPKVDSNDVFNKTIEEVNLCLLVHHVTMDATFNNPAEQSLLRTAFIFSLLPTDMMYTFRSGSNAVLRTPQEEFERVKEKFSREFNINLRNENSRAYFDAIVEAGKTCAMLHDQRGEPEGISEYLYNIRGNIGRLRQQRFTLPNTKK